MTLGHRRTSKVIAFLALLSVGLTGCGDAADGPPDASPYPNCEARSSGCVCTPDGPSNLEECTETSVGGVSLCCAGNVPNESPSCRCTEMACGQETSTYCLCGPIDIVLDPGTIRVTSCQSSASIHCCLGTAYGAGALCNCSTLECFSFETEVFECDTAASSSTCGDYDDRVPGCT